MTGGARHAGHRLIAGLWFTFFLNLRWALSGFQGETGRGVAIRVIVPFVIGAGFGWRVLDAGRTETAGRAIGIGLVVGALSYLGILLFTAPPATLLWGIAAVGLPSLAGAVASLLLYFLRGRGAASAVEPLLEDTGSPSHDLTDTGRLARAFDWIASAQLVVGGLLIAWDALILARGFSYNPTDPVASFVIFLTGAGDLPTTDADYSPVGALLLVGSALIASGLLAVNRPDWARSPLRFIHSGLAVAGALGIVLFGLASVVPWAFSGWVFFVPSLLLAWTSYRFLKRLSSRDLIAETPEGSKKLRSGLTTVILVFWLVSSAFILFEPARPAYTIGWPDTQSTSWAERIGFSPDGRFLAYCRGSDVLLFNPPFKRAIYKTQGSREVHAIAFSPSSRYLAWAAPPLGRSTSTPPSDADLGVVRIWKLPDRNAPVNPEGPRTGLPLLFPDIPLQCRCDPSSLSFSPDDRDLMVGSSDGTVWRIALATGEFTQAFRAYGPPNDPKSSGSVERIAFARDRRTLVTLGRDAADDPLTCKSWDAETFAFRRAFSLRVAKIPDSSLLSSEANAIALPDESGHVYVWDIETGSRRGPVGDPHDRAAFTPSGDALVLSSGTKIEVRAFPSLQPITRIVPWHRWPLPVPPLMAISPQGLAATGGGEYPNHAHTIRIWDLETRSRKH